MLTLSIRHCETSRVLLHAVKSYDMGPSRFTSHPRGRCAADFYRPYNPSPWPGSNTQPLILVASTLHHQGEYCFDGVKLCLCDNGPLTAPLSIPHMILEWTGAAMETILKGENRRIRSSHSTTLSTTNSSRTDTMCGLKCPSVGLDYRAVEVRSPAEAKGFSL
jgi:hypothetical protein